MYTPTSANRPIVDAFLASLVDGVWCIILRVCAEFDVIVLALGSSPPPVLPVSYERTGRRMRSVTRVEAL